MFFFFGWGKKTVKEFGEVIPTNCAKCNNKVYLKLVSVTKWFTLFFIPVIPYQSQNLLLCNICQNGYELNKEQFEKAKQMAQYTSEFKNDTMDIDTYKKYLDENNIFG